MSSNISFCTYNVRGLRNNSKRRKIFVFLHRRKYDFIFLQETHSVSSNSKFWANEWGGKVFMSHGSNLSKGTAILIKPSLSYDVKDVILDDNGRFVILFLSVLDFNLALINIYAPNLDNPSIIRVISNHISNNTSNWDFIIWGGDFNFVMNLDLDKKGGRQQTNFNVRSSIINAMQSFNLIDIWRERNPKLNSFTWHSNIDSSIHCRLDFFLISNSLKNLIIDCKISPGIGSDHSTVFLNLQLKGKRGKGIWKLNTSLLNDPTYISLIKTTIHRTIINNAYLNPIDLWELCKLYIRSESITFSKANARNRKKLEDEVIEKIAALEKLSVISPSDEIAIQLLELRNKLERIYDYKLKGIIIRSRARWVEEGEKNSSYFLSLEKRNKAIGTINEIFTADNNLLSDPNDILREAKSFYEKLYDRDINISSEFFYNSINFDHVKLSEDEKDSCEGDLTLQDCTKSLLSMSNNKSPGSDGIPVEFYQLFWDDIGELMVNSFNCSYINGFTSIDQGMACLNLIPKGKKDPRYLKNWRPISLLNVDYKIAVKAIASRIKTFIPYLISNEQTGFIKGRYIGENIRIVYDLIDFCNDTHTPGALLFLDYEKAFDSIDHNFIINTLSYFNFGPSIIQWVRTFYGNTSSCIVNNGYVSGRFKVSRGVRQGCPLSPYLFIICTEILHALITYNDSIIGISVGNTSFKLSQYADDMVIICDGTENSLREVYNVLNLFTSISGLKVNFDKSFIFSLGPYAKNHPHYFENSLFRLSNDTFTYLGISISNHHEDFFRLNFTPKLSRVKHLLQLWSSRDLTPIGKIQIIKAFAISQIVYLLLVLPNPPKSFFEELNSIFFKFIWCNKPDKVKRNVMYNNISSGGLNMINMDVFNTSLKSKWVKMYLDYTGRPWKSLFDYYLRCYGSKFLFKCNFASHDLHISNNFILNVCQAWSSYSFHVPASNYGDQCVLNNSFIKIDSKMLFKKSLLDSNAIHVKDFFDDNASPLSYDTFTNNFNLRNFTFTLFFGIINAIPKMWRANLLPYLHTVNDNIKCLLTFCSAIKPTRHIYKSILNYTAPNCIRKWDQVADTDWNTIFKLPFVAIRDSKVHYFQFRFLHRIIGVNSFLHKIKISESPLCSFCGEVEETIEHLFWDCIHVQLFWSNVCNQCIKIDFKLSGPIVFFGYTAKLNHPLNFFLLNAKHYIFSCKFNNTKPIVSVFKKKFKFLLSVEEYITKHYPNKSFTAYAETFKIPDLLPS